MIKETVAYEPVNFPCSVSRALLLFKMISLLYFCNPRTTPRLTERKLLGVAQILEKNCRKGWP
jgi:hypothetical protein